MNIKTVILNVVGAVLLVSAGVVGAQDTTTDPVQDNAQVEPAQQGRPFEGGLFDGEMRDLIQQYTGLERQEIAQALRGGETLADLITANGGDVDAFVNEAVALAEARIDEAVDNGRIPQERADEMKANVRQGIEQRINGEAPLMERRRGGAGAGNFPLAGDGEFAALVEQYTGLTPPEVAEAVRGGETIADLIAANGGDVEAFIDEATALAEARIDERAAQMKDNARDAITGFVNGERPLRRN